MTTGRRRCSPWWTVSSGTHRGQRNHLYLRSCNRCLPLRGAWATRCVRSLAASTLLDGRLVLNHPRIGIIAHHFDHATIPGLNVSDAVSFDTHKFVVPNRIHIFGSGRVDGLTGRMDHSDAVMDLHRETRDRLGPNPHWPVCHRFGPRFIIICHPSYSSGQFIYPQTPWGFNL